MPSQPGKKLVLVIGATGAQGLAVIESLLKPCEEHTPSPYAIRALTRDPNSRRAQELTRRGVEVFPGNTPVCIYYCPSVGTPLAELSPRQAHLMIFPLSHEP